MDRYVELYKYQPWIKVDNVNKQNSSHKKVGHLLFSAVCEGEEGDDERGISKSLNVYETAAPRSPHFLSSDIERHT